MIRVLAFRHVPFEGIGLIAPALERAGIAVEYADLFRDPACPDPAAYHALLFMGGPMSVNDPLPFIGREIDIIAAAAARRQPVLGVCLGAQLLAKALGARVGPNPAKEIGWYPVHFSPEAASDPLLGGIASPQEIFHWHGETFELPPGAVHLASSPLCRNQAFHVEHFLYGFQFHLEVTPDMIADWCAQDVNCGDIRELTEPVDAFLHSGRLAGLSQSVFGRWATLISERPRLI